MNHGAKEPVFGVKIEDLKKIYKTERGNNSLAKQLFGTGNYDAMYLAGLIADGAKMTTEEIRGWADTAYGSGIGEYIVPWVSSENKEGYALARRWIDSEVDNIAATGWATFSNILSVWPDEKLDKQDLKLLLARVRRDIHHSPNRVRYTMNGFVIAVGCYVPDLKEESLSIARQIGQVVVDMNGTACKVPAAADYIVKVEIMGRTGQKRKTAKC